MKDSRFGRFGGQFVPETLMNALQEVEQAYEHASQDAGFLELCQHYGAVYTGRPSPLYLASNLTRRFGGAKIYLKREDLNHTGAHKINNVIGQVLLAKRMGKSRIIAETGAGQHGVATATVCAMMGMPCEVFMGEVDIERQKLNVYKMKLLGATLHGVKSGTATLKDAANEAIRAWVSQVEDTFYVIGSVVGPHPYPRMVRDFQKVIGEEAKSQILQIEGRLPDCLIACVGGGSNAMGLFQAFLKEEGVRMIGVEAGGEGIDSGRHAAALQKGKVGVLHGMMTYLLQDSQGQILPVHSVSAGLDYPGVGPEHAFLHESGRVHYTSVTDQEALEAFHILTEQEGILPALESAHALAQAFKVAPCMSKDGMMIVNLSGRGDKDIATVEAFAGERHV